MRSPICYNAGVAMSGSSSRSQYIPSPLPSCLPPHSLQSSRARGAISGFHSVCLGSVGLHQSFYPGLLLRSTVATIGPMAIQGQDCSVFAPAPMLLLPLMTGTSGALFGYHQVKRPLSGSPRHSLLLAQVDSSRKPTYHRGLSNSSTGSTTTFIPHPLGWTDKRSHPQ
ncbi:hypothetical protein BGX38DRAFT_597893 [Terfezia claveryi]|nr:hypothetical protein BGX38DRAFT_597893 [Terfezia claveryi]